MEEGVKVKWFLGVRTLYGDICWSFKEAIVCLSVEGHSSPLLEVCCVPKWSIFNTLARSIVSKRIFSTVLNIWFEIQWRKEGARQFLESLDPWTNLQDLTVGFVALEKHFLPSNSYAFSQMTMGFWYLSRSRTGGKLCIFKYTLFFSRSAHRLQMILLLLHHLLLFLAHRSLLLIQLWRILIVFLWLLLLSFKFLPCEEETFLKQRKKQWNVTEERMQIKILGRMQGLRPLLDLGCFWKQKGPFHPGKNESGSNPWASEPYQTPGTPLAREARAPLPL